MKEHFHKKVCLLSLSCLEFYLFFLVKIKNLTNASVRRDDHPLGKILTYSKEPVTKVCEFAGQL